MTEQPPTIGIVLGGGGIAGYAFHCSVLAAIHDETGFDPRTADIVVGTSAGAIAGAVIRGHVSADEMRNRLQASADDPEELATLKLLSGRSRKAIPRIWGGPGSPALAMQEIRKGRNLSVGRLLAGILPEGRLSLGPISKPLETLHGTGWPEEHLWIPAIDLESGQRVVFGRDHYPTVAEAVEASAALPAFFAPAIIDDKAYVDGGLSSPFNADLLIGYRQQSGRPLDLVIVLAPLSLEELNRTTPMASAVRSVPRRQLRGEILYIEAEGTKTLVFQPSRSVARAMGLNPMDHNRVGSIMDRSDTMVRRQLAEADEDVLQLLRRASRLRPSPPDVAYPVATGA